MASLNKMRATRSAALAMGALLSAVFLSAGGMAAGKPSSPRVITTKGTILAYGSGLACLNGYGHWYAIILFDHVKKSADQYGRVNFSLPCDKHPDWMSTPARLQTLKLIRTRDDDGELPKLLLKMDDPGTGEPVPEEARGIGWNCRDGADCSHIPYGTVVRSYTFADTPERPLL
jgi:hypothetical protein